MAQNRIQELDALRGVAAFSVVIFHYVFRYNEIYGYDDLSGQWAAYLHLGVEMFFIVSGFVIFWTLDRIKKAPDFIVSRFSRLYPVYWAAVIVTYTIITVVGMPGREVPLETALLNVMMIQGVFHIKNVDGVYWTLTIEMFFYGWMFALYLFKALDKAEHLLLGILGLAVAKSVGWISFPGVLDTVFLLKYSGLFLLGICFFNIVNQRATPVTYIAIVLALLSVIPFYKFNYTYFFAISGVALLLYLAVAGHLQFLVMKPLLFLGGISYSLYLIHQNIGYLIIKGLTDGGVNSVLSIAIAVATAVVLAWLLTTYVEKPSITWIRNTYKRFQAKG